MQKKRFGETKNLHICKLQDIFKRTEQLIYFDIIGGESNAINYQQGY